MPTQGFHFGPVLPPDPDWDDDALAGCRAWLGGWRQSNGTAANPPKDRHLIAAVGRDAVRLMRDGVPRAELCRLMWAAGRDGVTLDVSLKAAP
jgi:hypothetical protein